MDQDEQARRDMEQALEQIGVDAGMTDICAHCGWNDTGAIYRDAQNGLHVFTFPPVGGDTVLELPQ